MAVRNVPGFALRYPADDLTGARFGLLTLVAPTAERKFGYLVWKCACQCGGTAFVSTQKLKSGYGLDCGCVRKRIASPEYQIWKGIKKRCSLNGHHLRYAGRGITMCERWNDFSAFLADMGHRPSPQHSIDRINNDGNYEPGNCRWATWSQQLRNTSRSVSLTFRGETRPLLEWAERYGLTEKMLRSRIDHGWDIERALTSKRFERKSRHDVTS